MSCIPPWSVLPTLNLWAMHGCVFMSKRHEFAACSRLGHLFSASPSSLSAPGSFLAACWAPQEEDVAGNCLRILLFKRDLPFAFAMPRARVLSFPAKACLGMLVVGWFFIVFGLIVYVVLKGVLIRQNIAGIDCPTLLTVLALPP